MVLILSPIEMEGNRKILELKFDSYFISATSIGKQGAFMCRFYDNRWWVGFSAPQTCQDQMAGQYMCLDTENVARSIPSHDLAHRWAGSMTLQKNCCVLEDGRWFGNLPDLDERTLL